MRLFLLWAVFLSLIQLFNPKYWYIYIQAVLYMISLLVTFFCSPKNWRLWLHITGSEMQLWITFAYSWPRLLGLIIVQDLTWSSMNVAEIYIYIVSCSAVIWHRLQWVVWCKRQLLLGMAFLHTDRCVDNPVSIPVKMHRRLIDLLFSNSFSTVNSIDSSVQFRWVGMEWIVTLGSSSCAGVTYIRSISRSDVGKVT